METRWNCGSRCSGMKRTRAPELLAQPLTFISDWLNVGGYSDTRSTPKPDRPCRLLDSTGSGWMDGGRVSSATDQARPLHIDLRGAGNLRGGLCGGVVLLQPRPHAAIHTRSINRSNVRAAEGHRGSRRCRECAGVTRKRGGVRVGISQPQTCAEAHVFCEFIRLSVEGQSTLSIETPVSPNHVEVLCHP